MLILLRVDVTGSRVMKTWYDEFFSIHLETLLRDQIQSRRYSEDKNISIYRLNPGNVVGLVRNGVLAQDRFEFRRSIQKEMEDYSKNNPSVEIYTWPIYFSYSSIIKMLKKIDLVENVDIENISRSLMLSHIKRAYSFVKALNVAEEQLSRRNYREAIQFLSLAIQNGDEDEADPYILRRYYEAYAGLKDWEKALEYITRRKCINRTRDHICEPEKHMPE